MLWLPNNQRMLPETLDALLRLVKEGANILGNPPHGMATLSGGQAAEQRFQETVKAIWGTPALAAAPGVRKVGKGRVFSGMEVSEALNRLKIARDFQGGDLAWNHRQAAGGDWYFVAAPASHGFRGAAQFRAAGEVEFWDPLTGASTPARLVKRSDALTSVALDLPPAGSVFVVFHSRRSRTDTSIAAVERDGKWVAGATPPALPESAPAVTTEGEAGRLVAWEAGKYEVARDHGSPVKREVRGARQIKLAGPWTLAFPPGWGAPAKLQISQLGSWTELDLPAEARAFSGTVAYTAEFDAGILPSQDVPAEFDLGQVEVIARVFLNGKLAGTVWLPSQRLNISGFLKPGLNRVAIEVTNTWFNRLAYDAAQPEASRKTWTISGPAKGSALVPSGLLGPVAVRLGEPL